MEEILARHSFEVTDDGLSYLYIRLRSRPETKAMSEVIKAVREKLRADYFSLKDARLERRAATAEIEALDNDVDGTVMDLSFGVAAGEPQRKNSPLWKYLFPKPPSEGMKDIGSPEQERYVMEVLQRLEEPQYASFLSQATKIRAALDLLKAAQAQRTTFALAEQKARDAYLRTHEESRDSYNKMPSRLRLDLDFSKKKIETFFAPLSSKPKASSPADPPSPEET